MLTNRSVGLPWLVVILGAGWASAADPTPVAALKQKGLTKSGVMFVIAAESPVLAKIQEARALIKDYNAAAEARDEAGRLAKEVTELEATRTELQERLNDLNQQINEQGFQQGNNQPRRGPNGAAQGGLLTQFIAQRNMIKTPLEEINERQKALKAEATTGKDPKALDDELAKHSAEFKAALADLRPLADEVTRKYAELGSDASVKQAIGELERTAKVKFKLGPSDAFKSGMKAIDGAERTILGVKPHAVPRKKKGKARS